MPAPLDDVDFDNQLAGLIAALTKQIDALADHADQETKFDKKIIDDIYNVSRALTKVRELINVMDRKEKDSSDDDASVVAILNTIEERIEQLAQQRAEVIIAQQDTGEAQKANP